jgi:hypothetical protein
MEANELRIGNWLINPFGGKGTVESIYLDSVKLKESNSFVPLVHCKPIQLTDEILLKCGFVKINKSRYLRKGALTICIEPNNIFRFSLDGSFLVNLEFLHQLQNLYFALTGKELQITL